jgi:hypothetical protein
MSGLLAVRRANTAGTYFRLACVCDAYLKSRRKITPEEISLDEEAPSIARSAARY